MHFLLLLGGMLNKPDTDNTLSEKLEVKNAKNALA